MMEEATGELIEQRLDHDSGEARAFYRSSQGPFRVGIELKPMLKVRKLLIRSNAKNAKNGEFAEVRYTEPQGKTNRISPGTFPQLQACHLLLVCNVAH
jgi:hypothetical protein